MMKIILSSLLFSTILSADNFELFLQKAVQNSPYLKASALDIAVAKEESNKLLRYENPSLGLDYSKFDPDMGSRDDGYGVSISQPIRLWSVSEDKKILATTMQVSADSTQIEQKARFIRDMSLLFSSYTKIKMLISLGDQEQEIAQKIYDISKERFSAGTIAKKEMLQANASVQMSKIKKQSLELEAMQKYYELLKFAGISEDIELNINYNFKIISTKEQNPNLLILQNKKEKSLALASLSSNKVEWINLNASYEKEYEQDISSLGIALPLTIFNTKSQEKKIANLKVKQVEIMIENKKKSLMLALKGLKIERKKLSSLKRQNENILQIQERLLKMFEKGYKISKSNLLELQDVKNRVIETNKRLIFITSSLDKNAITTNYMQGAYNE